jgi:GNAT superfamily N-acetyltransferase
MTQCDPQYSIRPAVGSDQAGILKCLTAAFGPYRKDYTAGAFTDTVLDATSLGERLRQMHILVATPEVATSESAILGTIAGKVSADKGHIRGMAVLPELQGTGVAGHLLSAIEAWLREQGCNRVTLNSTLPLGAAMRFYEKNGYVRSGRTSDFFGLTLVEYAKTL